MRPDFFLHLIFTIAFFLAISLLFGWKKALYITLFLQVGKEVYDFLIDPTNIDPIDWLGDSLGLLIGVLLFKTYNGIYNSNTSRID